MHEIVSLGCENWFVYYEDKTHFRNILFIRQVDIQALDMQIEEKRKIDCLKREEENKFITEDRRRADILKSKADELAKVKQIISLLSVSSIINLW